MRNIIKFNNTIDREYFRILLGFYRIRKIQKTTLETAVKDILKNIYPSIKFAVIINDFEVNTIVKNYGILITPSTTSNATFDAVFSIDSALIDALPESIMDSYFFTAVDAVPAVMQKMEEFIINKTVRVDLNDVVNLYADIYLTVIRAIENNTELFSFLRQYNMALTADEVIERINKSVDEGDSLESRIQLFMSNGAFPIFIIRKIQEAYKEFNEIADETKDVFASRITAAINVYTDKIASMCTTKDEPFYNNRYATPEGVVVTNKK